MLNIRLEGKLPIYEQLYNGISRLISSGELEPDERLPAVREVAKQFGINPNTVQKSYSQLEQAGLIYSIPAKGSYDNSILKQMCQPAIQTILNFENSESIRIEQKNAGESMVEKKNKVLGTEYHVTVQYGQERLEKLEKSGKLVKGRVVINDRGKECGNAFRR